jgi:hypothetical protein
MTAHDETDPADRIGGAPTITREAMIYRDHPAVVTIWILFVTITTLALSAAFCHTWYGNGFPEKPPPLSVLAMLSGIFGSWLSVMIKLADTKDTTRFATASLNSRTGGFWAGFRAFQFISLPGLIGAFLGLVMALLFASTLLQGSLFPKMACVGSDACKNFSEMIQNYTVQSPEDLAKLVFWCFMAGFAERFVLNILDGYSKPRGERSGSTAS